MLRAINWIIAGTIVLLIVCVAAGAFLSSKPPITSCNQQQASSQDGTNQKENQESDSRSIWVFFFPDALSVFTFLLVLVTAGLVTVSAVQINYLARQEIVATDAANAAKKSADTSREAMVKSQRAFVRVAGWPWLWRPDFDRKGKIFFDITPILENAGATPTVDARVVIDSALRDEVMPDNFDFPFRAEPGVTTIGARQTVGLNNQIITDDDLLAVQNGKKFFYIWGTVTYRDVFDGTPPHITEFCTQISRVIGNPLAPQDPANPKGTSVEISFAICRQHQKSD